MKRMRSVLQIFFLTLVFMLAGCIEITTSPLDDNVGGTATAQCRDGIDNDNDGLIDLNDPGCANTSDGDESDDPIALAQCRDGIDNDNDGMIDLSDSGCANANDDDESNELPPVRLPQCRDGIDNDGDGKIDLNDPGCSNTTDDNESNDPILLPQCSDGIDNDGDGLIDPNDPGCANATDNDESNDPILVAQCGDGIDNDSDGLTDLNDPGCANTADNDEKDEPIPLAQCRDGIDNDNDGMIDLNDSGCANATDNDESNDPVNPAQCNDGIDNDDDGFTDLNDPGCASANDDDESDDPVPLTQCSDGIDNDSDGMIDLNDSDCANAGDNDESDNTVGSAPSAARANSYDNTWELDWIAKAKNIIATPIDGITKIAGKVLHVGDSITYSNAYSSWIRAAANAGATESDLATINWMHGNNSDTSLNGWVFSTKSTTSANGAGWWDSVIDSVLGDSSLTNAQFAVVMFNVPANPPTDLSIVQQRVDEFIAKGIVPILSTIPPRKPGSTPDYNEERTRPYNAALRTFAQVNSLPLIDFYEEILLRRPGDSWIFTLIGKAGPPEDGVHPTGGVNGFLAKSDPYAFGGDPTTHTTGDATLNSGYLLRTWLTLQKMKEIKLKVID